MMTYKTVLKKGSAYHMKSSITSPGQARRIQRAIVQLQNYKLSELERIGKVKKLKVTDSDNIYSFRVGPRERIIFSPIDGKIIIHNIVDINNHRSFTSLLADIEED